MSSSPRSMMSRACSRSDASTAYSRSVFARVRTMYVGTYRTCTSMPYPEVFGKMRSSATMTANLSARSTLRGVGYGVVTMTSMMSSPIRVGSLFSGIGGFDLGFERAGMEVVFQAESDQFCRAVLRKHWPDVPCFDDVRKVDASAPPVEVVCGGFPCQDISSAGRGIGIGGSRSGLWKEFARIVGDLRPEFVVVENVQPLTKRGLHVVLGDLSELGYDAEWETIRACDFGSPHKRARIWIVAYPVGFASRFARAEQLLSQTRGQAQVDAGGDGEEGHVADSSYDVGSEGADPVIFRAERWRQSHNSPQAYAAWRSEPTVCRVVDGLPNRLDRVRTLGNALVPQIAQWIGEGIIAAYETATSVAS